MKKVFLTLAILLVGLVTLSQNVGIGGSAFVPSQRLHVEGNQYLNGDLYIRTNYGVGSLIGTVHHGPTGLLGQSNGLNFGIGDGLWVESSHDGESSGVFMNGNSLYMWSPGNNDLFRLYDEDIFPTINTPRFVINGSGYVGINKPIPTQYLDVTGNVQFTGSLMPNGNAGTSGSFLRSSGPGLPPVWTTGGVNVASINTIESNADLCISVATFTTYPGCQLVLNLTAGQYVFAIAEAGIMTDNNCDGISDAIRVVVDARIAVNGADFPNGAWLRTSLDNAVGYVMFNSVTVVGSYLCTSSGAYTFAFQARRAGGTGNAISGGNNLSSLQATMVLIVYTP